MENKAFIICSSVATSASKCRRSLCYFSLLNRAERKPGHKTSLSMCVWRRKALSLTKHPPRLWLTAPQVKGTAAVVQTFLPAVLVLWFPIGPGADGTELSCKATVSMLMADAVFLAPASHLQHPGDFRIANAQLQLATRMGNAHRLGGRTAAFYHSAAGPSLQ